MELPEQLFRHSMTFHDIPYSFDTSTEASAPPAVECFYSALAACILKMSTKAKSTPVSSKASKTLKGQSKGKKINPKPLCNLCGSPFEDEEETLHCEGDCGQIYTVKNDVWF